MKVHECWVLGGWNIELLTELVGVKTEEILASKAMRRKGSVINIWKLNNDGNFTTAFAWETITSKEATHEWMKWIWRKKIPKNISICMWKAFKFC